METALWKSFRSYCHNRNKQYITDRFAKGIENVTERIKENERSRWQRIETDFQERKANIVHSNSRVNVQEVIEEHPNVKVFYDVWITWKIKQHTHEYEQSWLESRLCILKEKQRWVVVEDEPQEKEEVEGVNIPAPLDTRYNVHNPNERRGKYNRKKAVEYAERWWDDYNPKFKQFDVDCTNFISQCLYAGGAPMKYSSDRARGWWYRFEEPENWSFSWSVAHSLRWYLPSSQSGLRAKEVSSADQLQPGDVICYDFDGDGRWQHNTIVVAKDGAGMPLVNAHTTNSRQRSWSYKDSYAWTEKIKYKFFQIADDF